MLTETYPLIAQTAGPLLPYLLDPDVMEIRVAYTGACHVAAFGKGRTRVSDVDPLLLDGFLAVVTSAMEAGEWRKGNPRLHAANARIGFRIQASRPPIAPGIQMVLRKHPARVFPLDDFVAKEILTPRQRFLIEDAIANKLTVMLAGSTGSAKTSLANAILHSLRMSAMKISIVEDDPELICDAPDVTFERCHDGDEETPAVTMRDLCKALLRFTPDLIVVGEFRDGAALDAMKAFTTGHQGLCTVHADTAQDALLRLDELILEVSAAPQHSLVGRAIDLIVHMEVWGPRWRITEMRRVHGWDGREYVTEVVE